MAFVMVVAIEIDAPACEEHGRVTRAYMSGYTRRRVHESKLYPAERRCLVVNVNGAVAKGETIKRVEWRMDPVYAVGMADASIEGREARVIIRACYPGEAAIKAAVTLSNDEVYVQLFRVRVLPGPYFGDELTAAGPAMLQADA